MRSRDAAVSLFLASCVAISPFFAHSSGLRLTGRQNQVDPALFGGAANAAGAGGKAGMNGANPMLQAMNTGGSRAAVYPLPPFNVTALGGSPGPLPDLPPETKLSAPPVPMEVKPHFGNATEGEESEEKGEEGDIAGINPEVFVKVRKAISDQKNMLSNLKTDIDSLTANLTQAREEEKARQAGQESQGKPDSITLSIKYPQKEEHEKEVEEKAAGGAEKAGKEEKGEKKKDEKEKGEDEKEKGEDEKEKGEDEKEKKEAGQVIKVKPVPFIFVRSDSRGDLEKAVESAMDEQRQEAKMAVAEFEAMKEEEKKKANQKKITTSERIASLQAEYAKAIAKEEFFETDREMTEDRLNAGGGGFGSQLLGMLTGQQQQAGGPPGAGAMARSGMLNAVGGAVPGG